MQKILGQVLDVIRPSRQEMKGEIQFTKTLLAHIRANSPSGCEVVLTGSMAKRTFIREKRDVDVFVLFKRSVPRGHLEPAIKGILKKAFPGRAYQLSYAEHPYARFRLEGRRIDLVPAYRIADASERVSAVDRSVLHTSYVLRNLKSVDDVLLLKSFLQANSLYGAEIKVQGFSGYLCELLIIRHGSFIRLLRAASKWKPPGHPVFIDIKKYHKGRKAIREATLRFGNLTVIDPTDRNRNVAAAVSTVNLAGFVRLCREFLKKPSAQAFLRKPESFEERVAGAMNAVAVKAGATNAGAMKAGALKAAKGAKLFMVTLPRPDVVDDVLWGQLHRMIGQLEHHLAGFKPESILADDSQHIIRLAVLLKKDSLPTEMVVEGPPLGMKAHAKGFRASHRGARFIARKRKLCAIVKRPITSAEGAITDFFRKLGKTKSHLACGEELVVLEPIRRGKKPPSS